MLQGATDLFCDQCYILNTVSTIVIDAECVWYGALGSHVVRASPAQEGVDGCQYVRYHNVFSCYYTLDFTQALNLQIAQKLLGVRR
jgi:hypothetical protein